MPKTKKLENKISKKLEKLSQLLDEFEEVRVINSDDPDTWDSDTLYNLVENLKEALSLLQDKESQKEKDNFGQPLILEVGLCTLLDEYNEEEEEDSEV